MSVVPSPSPEIPAAAVPVAEGTPETPPPAEPKPQEQLARHFAALSKKEKALFRQQEALKAEKAAIAADKARIAELEAKYGARPATPKEALERYGYSYRDATEYELNDGAPTAEHLARQAQEEVKKLREEQAAREQRQAEEATKRAQAEREEVIQEFKGEIQSFVTDKAEEYELIKFHEAYEVVYHTIEEHYARTGKLLSIPEGANMVEKYLEKRMDELSSTKKFAKKRQQGDPPAPESGFGSKPEATAQRRTLDNTVTSSTPTLIKTPRVEEDRMKRALAALDRR